jgi:hypothetical protein
MNSMKHTLPFVALFLLSFIAPAQDCLEQLKKMYKAMESSMNENEGNVFHLKYQMMNEMGAAQGGATVSTRVEILSQSSKSYYLSDQASIYQDAQTTYTVMPGQKEIIISPNMGESIREARLTQIMTMQQRILNVAELQSCREVLRNGKKVTEISIVLPLSEQEATKVREITFVADFASNMLLENSILYVSGSEIVSSKMIYEKVDYNLATNRLKQPVASEIFVSGQELNSQYKGYKVINYTNQ